MGRAHLLAIASFALPAALVAQSPQAAGFVTMIGSDTLAVESDHYVGLEIRGTSVVRSPRVTLRDYTIALTEDGSVASVRVSYGGVGLPPAQVVTWTYSDDSVVTTVQRDSATTRNAVAVSGRPLPFFENLFATWELALRKARDPNRGETHFEVLAGRRTLAYDVKPRGDGRLDLLNPDRDFGPLLATMDEEGRLQRLDLRETTDKYLVTRVPAMDVMATATTFAERERAGHGLGMLSPRDTARATVGKAHVAVDYGRPSVRGRTIFGNVVPWNEVWRAGANQATQLITDATLHFGNVTVPPGTYSLFTIPSESGWKLIINKQHGQWGTDYNPKQDLARVDMTTRALGEQVEQFTINVTAERDSGALVLRWASVEATAPFRVK